MPEEKNSARSESDAEFIGWQKNTLGDDIALYNVTAEQHPLYRSTVSEETLRRENLKIPIAPNPNVK
jgi:hypothetical protein